MIAQRQENGKWLVRNDYDVFGVGDSLALIRLQNFEQIEISAEDLKQLRKDIEKNSTIHFLIFCEPTGKYSLWFNKTGVVGLHRAFKDLIAGGEGWTHGGTPPVLGNFYECSVAYYMGTKEKLVEDRDFLNCYLSDIDSRLISGNAA